jgi:hypothetical protein
MHAEEHQSSTEDLCPVYSISLNDIHREYDGQWQGIIAASDGKCYFGSSTHSPRHGVGFFRFDPRTKDLTMLVEDMTKVCGEDLSETPPQGKIHSPVVECDGWLYFTTHLSNYWEEAMNAYTGAHVLGYDMAAEEFRDFGIVRPRHTIYSAIDVDPERRQLYVFSVPFAPEDVEKSGCNVFRIDIDTGEMTDLGRVIDGQGASFWFYVDHTGDCWFTIWRKLGHFDRGGHGNLYRVRAGSGEIERYDDVLPEGRMAPSGEPVPEEKLDDRAWTWAQPLPGRKQCLFTMGYLAGEDERLWVFDPSEDIESGEAFEAVSYIGPTFLPVALGKKRVYYTQRADMADHRGWGSGEHKRDDDPDEVGWPENLHLRSLSLLSEDEGAVIDHGKIVDQDGREPRHIDSLAADLEGRVYSVGGWHLLAGDTSTLQVDWETPELDFEPVPRAQRFAVADVSDDLE